MLPSAKGLTKLIQGNVRFSNSSLLLSNSFCRAASFANFEGILGFSVPSIILADPLKKNLFSKGHGL